MAGCLGLNAAHYVAPVLLLRADRVDAGHWTLDMLRDGATSGCASHQPHGKTGGL